MRRWKWPCTQIVTCKLKAHTVRLIRMYSKDIHRIRRIRSKGQNCKISNRLQNLRTADLNSESRKNLKYTLFIHIIWRIFENILGQHVTRYFWHEWMLITPRFSRVYPHANGVSRKKDDALFEGEQKGLCGETVVRSSIIAVVLVPQASTVRTAFRYNCRLSRFSLKRTGLLWSNNE